jgi:hypothetical protein
MHFRNDALPMLVEITDVDMHNGKRALDKTGTSYDTTYQYPYSFTTFNADDLVTKLNALGAKYIGVGAEFSTPALRSTALGYPYGYQSFIADKTTSYVPPSAFTHTATCTAAQCCTGISGAGVAPDGPTIAGVQQCRLVYSIFYDGTGLTNSIVDGVAAILATIKFDVHVQAGPCTVAGTAGCGGTDSIDSVNAFMSSVLPSPSGGVDPSIGTCVSFTNPLADRFTGPKATAGADGTNETILAVNPGPLYCFNVVPKSNTTVAPISTAQVFHAALQVIAEKAGGSLALGAPRGVLFLVPPIVN